MIQTNLVNPSFHTFMTSISESRSLLNKIIFIQILGISGRGTLAPQHHLFRSPTISTISFDLRESMPQPPWAASRMSCQGPLQPFSNVLFVLSFFPFIPINRGFHSRSPLPISLVHSVLTNQLKNLHWGVGAWVEWRHEGDVDVEVILA